jgi:hypothetical protein
VKDTPPVIERKFRHMLMKRSGEERLKMGCSMHATAQALAKASLSQQHPGARPAELKRLLFLHFYGTDFEAKERKRIASALAERSRRNEAQEPGKRTTRKPADLIDLAIVKSSAGGVREREEKYGGKGKGKAKRSR